MVLVAHIVELRRIGFRSLYQMQVSAHSRLDIAGDHFGRTTTRSLIYKDACPGRGIHIRRIVRIPPTAEPGNQNLSVPG